jgi:hypothetical protein
VDKDGVEAGDQGKNRMPHDHNRDYGDNPIYPEIQAISDIAHKYKIHFAIDFHCPALRGDIHKAMHFLGLADGLSHSNQTHKRSDRGRSVRDGCFQNPFGKLRDLLFY